MQNLSPNSGSLLSRYRWIVVAALALAAFGVFLAWRLSGRESTDDAQIDGRIHNIAAKVGGTVQQILFTDNQPVDAGVTLVQIDPRDYEIAVARAEADLAAAEASATADEIGVPIATTTTTSDLASAHAALEQSTAGLNAAGTEIDAARARLESAQARLRQREAESVKAARDLDRLKELVEKDEISRQQYDAAVASADTSRAVVDAARSEVAESEMAIKVAESRLTQARSGESHAKANLRSAQTAPQQLKATQARASAARARANQARAALDQARLNLQYATVKAPVEGVVTRKGIEVGQIVQPGQPLFAIVSLDDIWVTANFKETQVRNMRPGQQAIVSVDAYGRRYEAHVDSLAPATGARFSLLPPENATGNYVKVVQRIPVKIMFEKGQDPEHRLRPGMSVDATVTTR